MINKFSYIIYFLIYNFISYKTDFGFEYTNGFELLWGSILCAIITGIIGNIIFRLAYDCTGFFDKLCDYNTNERKTKHWKFRMLLSIPLLLFSLTPLCSMAMTPLVHNNYELLVKLYYEIINNLSVIWSVS